MAAPAMTAPVEFPVTWDDPADAAATWRHDRMHFPRPLSPLFQTTFGPAFEYGFSTALSEFNAPVKSVRMRFVNGYHYEYHEVAPTADEAEAQAVGTLVEQTMREEIRRLRERWETEHLPRVQANLTRLKALDVGRAADGELVTFVDESQSILAENWLIHFRIVVPMNLATSMFGEFYEDIFDDGPLAAHTLLVGQRSKSVEAGLGLFDLVTAAAREPAVEQVLRNTPADQAIEALQQTDTGRAYIAKIHDYLERFGLRQDLFDYLQPTWREDPSIAIASIQAYLVSGHDVRAEHEQTARAAEAAIAAAREHLAAYPEQVRGQFEGMLEAARFSSFLQEEHNFYIDQQGLALARLFYLRVGQRFVDAGIIEQPDDILMLTFDDVRALAANPAGQDRRPLVAERRAEMDHYATLTPPPFIGEPLAGPPPDDNPMTRATLRFFGGPPQQADQPNQLKGNPGSHGTVTGIARVVDTLDEAKALLPGEILVAPTTMPPWTPLFATAAAVVTETGGSLSHCAIVAREYAIPAVVGAQFATQRIETGQRITVDGDLGVVTIET